MHKNTQNRLLNSVLITLGLLLIGGCATKTITYTQYDFGPLPIVASAAVSPAETATLPALSLSLADVHAPVWLDTTMMMFRLAYANDLQPRPYATTRWSMPPPQLFSQRLKARISLAGGTVVSLSDGAVNLPVLRIDMDDFSQTFDSASHSVAQVSIRASLFNGRVLAAQKTFSRQIATPTADAAGGARAFATANDAVIDDLMAWLTRLPVKK
ncbi:ABC-type transport auxiliary lipoprotein family protein [Glaciimonas sp. PCH181]|uniref:ABC-type transport auxiliary lipoprotein family protein n=1 Tax=Glaciimonas sp. PCH181 TaxID=2133943 RepID=UPI000D343041|nr:ABC-type transport auxiliary lipoprotein family protein [Glaciimonas sp. PCH181]PUA18045.1 ABC transporter [Glaciimonas sp. PCH181]